MPADIAPGCQGSRWTPAARAVTLHLPGRDKDSSDRLIILPKRVEKFLLKFPAMGAIIQKLNICGCSSSVELRLPKPIRWVRLPSSAPFLDPAAIRLRDFSFPYPHTAVTALRRAWRALPRPNKKILAFRARVTITTRIFIYIIIFSILLYSSLFCSILLCSVLCTDRRLTSPRRRHDVGFRLPSAEPPQDFPAAVLFI